MKPIHSMAFVLPAVLASCAGMFWRPPPPDPITIPDLVPYIAQSRATNGDATIPLRAEDQMTYRRFDMGHYQATSSFLTGPDSAITTWSYDPWGSFSVDANGYGMYGDGGEKYIIQDGKILITDTRDGGKPYNQHFPIPWTLGTRQTKDCAQGWTTYNSRESGCHTTINYPVIGPVHTLVSRHGDNNAVEIIFLGKGWGRLAWLAFSRLPPPSNIVSRCPDFGWNSPVNNLPLSDCRIAVNIESYSGSVKGVDLWKP